MKKMLLIFPLICPFVFGCNNSKPVATTYTVKFKMNHIDYDSPLIPADQTIQENNQVREPTTSEYCPTVINTDRDKYTFKYWSTEIDGNAYDFSSKVTSSFTLYAIWNKFPALSVSYIRNNDDYSSDMPWPSNIPAIYGEKAKCPSEDTYVSTFLNKKNDKKYIFKYWSKTEDGEEYNFDETLTEPLALYAIWEVYTVRKVTFTHDIIDVDVSPWPNNLYINDGEYVREPTPDLEFPTLICPHGMSVIYAFEYWHQAGHEDEHFDFKNTKITFDIEIKAKYEARY